MKRPLLVVMCISALVTGCKVDLLNTKGTHLDKDLIGGTKAVALAGGFETLNNAFTTKSFVIGSVEGSGQNYTAYVAPMPGTRPIAEASVSVGDPTLNLVSGWGYLFGVHPSAKTRRVRAVGDGTRFIIQIDTNVDRVYLVPQSSTQYVRITPLVGNSPTPMSLSEQGKYVEIDDNGVISTPVAVVGSAQQTFVQSVRDAVMAQNLEWPNILGIPTWP